MSRAPRIAMLIGAGESSRIIFNAIDRAHGVVGVVREQAPSRRVLTQRRLKRVGAVQVGGQLAFQLVAAPILARRARSRIATIIAENGLDLSEIPPDRVVDVESANTPEAIEALRRLEPDVVLLNGTRIIGKRMLEGVGKPFVNTHAGITPGYRGVHGGYWALAQQRPELCGVTVHLVDTGIDTGGVLAQAIIRPGPEDCFPTYRFLQLAAAIPLLVQALPEIGRGNVKPVPPLDPASRLWYHPTIWQYMSTWWLLGVH